MGAETHARANLNTDHHPLTFQARVKLKQLKGGGEKEGQHTNNVIIYNKTV